MTLDCALNAATAGRDLPVGAYLALAQRQGYRWVELDREQIRPLAAMGLAASRDLLARSGTRIASFFLPVAWDGSEGDFDRDMAGLDEILRVAVGMGATRCCTWLMPNFPTP